MTNVATVVFDQFAQDFSAAVAAELAQQREERGVPYKTLVEETGISRATLDRMLNGRSEIELGELVRICASLGVDPFVLMRNARARVERPPQ